MNMNKSSKKVKQKSKINSKKEYQKISSKSRKKEKSKINSKKEYKKISSKSRKKENSKINSKKEYKKISLKSRKKENSKINSKKEYQKISSKSRKKEYSKSDQISDQSSKSELTSVKNYQSTTTTNKKNRNESFFSSVIIVRLLFLWVLFVVIPFFVYIFLNPNQEKKQSVCKTESCEQTGKLLWNSMNFKANPCENFYEYSCGGWIKQHPIPSDRLRISNIDLITEQIKNNIKITLSQGVNQKSRSKAVSVRLAPDLYKACLKSDFINRRGVEPLKRIIGKWPLTSNDTSNNDTENKHEWTRTYSKNLASFGIISIFSLFISLDHINREIQNLRILPLNLGLRQKKNLNIIKRQKIETAYKKMMLETAKLYSTDADHIIEKELEQVFDFESKLQSSTVLPDSLNVSTELVSLDQFSRISSALGYSLNWISFFNEIFKTFGSELRVSKDHPMVLIDADYCQEMIVILSETSSNIVQNYLNWVVIKHFMSYLGYPSRSISFEFEKAEKGLEKEAEDWKYCINQVEKELGFAISRLHLDRFLKIGTKEKIMEIIDDIKESFIETVEQIEWLDQATKEKAIEKCLSIQENLVYPDWIFSDQKLDEFYNMTNSKLKIDQEKYFEGILSIKQIISKKTFLRYLNPEMGYNNFPKPPIEVNAAYMPSRNSITILAGILNPPFFDPDRPAIVNFASIGAIVAHELIHAFDDLGRMYDKNGRHVNWWSEETLEKFSNRSKCFIKQYGTIQDNFTGKNLNGSLTIGENIADNGGVKQAYHAYQKYSNKLRNSTNNDTSSFKHWGHNGKSDSLRLPYISNYTEDQIFFLSYAHIFCTSMRQQASALQIASDRHSPAKYRVNIPLSNFKSFAKAFNCSSESPMNPKHKCSIWGSPLLK